MSHTSQEPPAAADSFIERMKLMGASVVSVFIIIFMAVALWAWFSNLGTKPVTDHTKNKNVVDELANAKDLATYVGAFFTTMVGYWFGSNGKEKAERKADAAQKEADKAKTNERALAAAATPDIVDVARQKYGYEIGVGTDGEPV